MDSTLLRINVKEPPKGSPIQTLYVDLLFIQNCWTEMHSVTKYSKAAIQQLNAFCKGS